MGKETGITFDEPVNKTLFFQNGIAAHIAVSEEKPPYLIDVPTNETDEHEAEHVVAAKKGGTGVHKVTVIKSGDALGATYLATIDAAAALAPHGNGRRGTSWDVQVTQSQGVSIGWASSEGVRRLSSPLAKTQVKAIAASVHVHGTLYEPQIDQTLDQVEEHHKNPTFRVNITVFQANNTSKVEFTTKKKNRDVIFPSQIADLPPIAKA